MERLTRIGSLTPKASVQVKESRLGIGFEKLDRGVFDPNKAYDKVAALGVKWVRIQSGWARTETQKGVYDFAWLDEVIENLVLRGLRPWICLCYGNALYTPRAAAVFGAVGCPPIDTAEERQAWLNYVTALVRRYKDRVTHYEIWNEPDGIWCWKTGVNAMELGVFSRDTALAIHAEYPQAEVIGGVICMRDLSYINTALATGMGAAVDALSFHEYTHDEQKVLGRVSSLAALGRHYNPKMRVIQGESGSQSRSDGCGALRGGAWTPPKQAKQLLRHTVADLMTEVEFTSYFSCMDMIEALNGSVDNKASYLDYGYFGVLAADFDENGVSTGAYTPKPSYYALQNLCALFSERFTRAELPILSAPQHSDRIFADDFDGLTLCAQGFRRENGACAYAYWNPVNLMTETFSSTITLQAACLPAPIRLIDPMNGAVYALPEAMIEQQGNGCVLLKHLPILDYPLLVTFGDFAV